MKYSENSSIWEKDLEKQQQKQRQRQCEMERKTWSNVANGFILHNLGVAVQQK